MTLNIGVVGYGYWGPNLVRNFTATEGCHVTAVCDRDDGRLKKVSALYPAVELFTDYQAFLDSGIDAVAIATPVASHHPLAMAALKAGKHVLIEKPMADSAAKAEELIDEAEARGLTLMVDHTFVYTGAVRKIRELRAGGELGDVLYFDSTRINLGLYQHDVDVIWDLAVHDLSILDFVMGEAPTTVSAVGTSHVAGMPEDMAYLSMFYESGAMAHVAVNWLAPVKVRRTIIGGTKRMVVWDDLEPSEKLKIYDKGVEVTDDPSQIYEMIVGYRMGDMWAPNIDGTEALAREAAHFVDCATNGTRPVTGGEIGLRVVQILEAASRSMKSRGNPIQLPAAPKSGSGAAA